MPTNSLIPFKEPGNNVTAYATAAVTGKTGVDISAALAADGTYSVAPCAAGALPFGFAEYDAAVGTWVGIVRKGLLPLTAGANINPGQLVQIGANAQVIPWDGTLGSRIVGKSLTSAVAGADAIIAVPSI